MLEKEIFSIAKKEFNIGSPKQLGEIIYNELKIANLKKTKKGSLATNANILEDLAFKGHKFPRLVLDWRQLSKLKNTYTDALQDQFIQQTSLNLTRSNGDLQFEGYISDYQITPISISSNDQANQNRLSIKVFVRYKNLLENDKSFEKSFNRFADFDSNIELSNIEEELMDEIIIELINDIFNTAVVNW